MNTLVYKTLVVTLTVLGSGLMPAAIAQAVDSPITDRPTASPTNSEETDPQINVPAEAIPESVISDENVGDNSLNGVLLPTTTNQEIPTQKAEDFNQDLSLNENTGAEPAKENSLVSNPSPENTLTEQVIPISGQTAELPQQDTSLFDHILPATGKTVNPLFDKKTSEDNTSIDQVTSVSQLSDVKPTDWAFQALQSLVERYGCIAGYPDGTFRGNRAMTRYEFAAGLNACLDKVRELITTGTINLATKEDLGVVQRLQEEFAAELATLRGRVDTLEARSAELEANQFSTTTKLNGQVLTYLGDAFGENADRANNTAFGYRVRLNLNTSFTGKDNLLVGLEATNLRRLDAATEFPQSRLRGATNETLFSATNISGDGSFKLNALQYSFPVGDKLQVFLNAFSSDRILSAPLSPFSCPTT